MPTLWYVKDGKRPNNQRGAGRELTLAEVGAIFKNYKFRLTPNGEINRNRESWGPEHVVLEVGADESDAIVTFGKSGFYLVEDLKPATAQALLAKYAHGAALS